MAVRCTVLLVLFWCGVLAGFDSSAAGHIVAGGYEGRYVTEGRNNLPAGGIGIVSYEFAAPVTLGVWRAEALDASYDEIQYSAATGFQLTESLDLSLALTAISANTAGHRDNDHELGATLAFSHGMFASSLVFTWSGQEDSAWLHAEHSIVLEHGVRLFAALGINGGYIAGERKGINHGLIGVRGEHPVSERLVLSWGVNYSHALRERMGDTTSNEAWGAFALRYAF